MAINDLADMTPPDVKAIVAVDDVEASRQRDVIMARRFHDGRHDIKLTDRLKEFLGENTGSASLRLNVSRTVALSVAERLLVQSIHAETEDENEAAAQNDFAKRVLDSSRIDSKQGDVHERAVVDGEHFLFIDFNEDADISRITPHQRFTSAETSDGVEAGDGEGVWLAYPNGDLSQKPIYGCKRWTERFKDVNGFQSSRERLNVYFADHYERYVRTQGSWQPFTEDGQDFPTPWLNPVTREPLGIPIVHFKNPDLRPEAMEAWGINLAINKTLIDMLTASDMTAFRILLTFGWKMEDTNGPLTFAPGQNIGTMNPDGKAQVIEGSNLSQFHSTIDKMIMDIAAATDTPASRFQMSGQVRAEGTLQEEKEALIAKVRRRSVAYGMAWADALKIARRLHNAFNQAGESFDESVQFDVLWGEFAVRSVAEKKQESEAKLAAGYSKEEVWRSVWGEDEDTIARMIQEQDQAQLRGFNVANGETLSAITQ